MNTLWHEFVVRPLDAFASSLAVLEEGMSVDDTVDAMSSRLVEGLGGPAVRPDAPSMDTGDLSPEDLAILSTVQTSLDNGLQLLSWFEQASTYGGFDESFVLERTFNRPGSSYGFFGRADLPGRPELPVMGNVQQMFYDAARVPADLQPRAAEWMRAQVREFVLRYFMRVSDFRAPETFTGEVHEPPPPLLGAFSWCPKDGYNPRGFGFSQLYYKLRDGRVGKFRDDEQYAVVDMRELGPTYEWIVVKVRIFDFDLRVRPFGDQGPEIVLGLNEESLLVLSRDLVLDHSPPDAPAVGEYGFGYAFIRNPKGGLIAYGPGQFDAAVEQIKFKVRRPGEVEVEMTFIANRPTEIVNFVLDPIDWTFRIADSLLFGVPSQVFAPLKAALASTPLRLGQFDPVYAYIAAANAVTFGWAGSRLCITRDQLDKRFLVQHFMQHYQSVVGSLLTWRQIPDWTDAASLPDWVVKGINI